MTPENILRSTVNKMNAIIETNGEYSKDDLIKIEEIEREDGFNIVVQNTSFAYAYSFVGLKNDGPTKEYVYRLLVEQMLFELFCDEMKLRKINKIINPHL